MKKTQSWIKVSKQQTYLDKINKTGNQNHLLPTIELVTDGNLCLVFRKILKKQHNDFRLLRLNVIDL